MKGTRAAERRLQPGMGAPPEEQGTGHWKTMAYPTRAEGER